MSLCRLGRLNDREMSLTSAEGRDPREPSVFGFRVYDSTVVGDGEQLAAASVPLLPCDRHNELELRQSATQGRYQRLHPVCLPLCLVNK